MKMKNQNIVTQQEDITMNPSIIIRSVRTTLLLLLVSGILFGGDITNNKTITNNGTMTNTGFFQNYKGGAGGTFNNTGGTYTNTGYFTNNNTGGADGTINISGGALEVQGAFTNDNGSTTVGASGTLRIISTSTNVTPILFSVSAGTVEYNGAAQNVLSATYGALNFGGSGIKTLSGAVTVNTSLTVNTNISLTDAGFQITGGSGTFTLASGTTLTLGNATATTMPTFSAYAFNSTSTVIYNSTSNQTISASPTYGLLTLTAASGTPTKTIGGTLTTNGDLTVNINNILSITGVGDVTVGGNFNLNGNLTNAGILTIGP